MLLFALQIQGVTKLIPAFFLYKRFLSRVDEGEGTWRLMDTTQVENAIKGSDSRKKPVVCFYKKPITFTQAVNYLTRLGLSDEPFGGRNWVMVIRTAKSQPEPPVDEFCEELSEKIANHMVLEILRQDKEEARAKRKSVPKMGTWSPVKTRSPVRGAKQRFVEATTFQQWYRKMETIVQQLPLPWPYKKKGAQARYAREALISLVLLTKLEGGDYAEVVRHAKSAGLNCLRDASERFNGDVAVPCPSYVHLIATEKISLDYYEQIQEHLDQAACQLYEERLGLPSPNDFAVDGTDLPAAEMEWRQANQYTTYTAQRVPFQITARLATNTVFNIRLLDFSSQAPLQEGLISLPPGSKVSGDKLYDIEANHQAAEALEIELHVPGKQHQGKPYQGEARARTRGRFDRSVYRQRKKVERFFGNLVTRGTIHLHSRSPHTRQIELELEAIAHNLVALRGQEFYAQAFSPLTNLSAIIRPQRSIESSKPLSSVLSPNPALPDSPPPYIPP